MKRLNEEEALKILKRLGVKTEPDEEAYINAPKNIPNPYKRPMLEVIMERQDKFGKSCDPGYRTIKEQEEEEDVENVDAFALIQAIHTAQEEKRLRRRQKAKG